MKVGWGGVPDGVGKAVGWIEILCHTHKSRCLGMIARAMLLSSEKYAQVRLSSSFQLDVGFIIAVKIKIEVALAKRSDSMLAQALC